MLDVPSKKSFFNKKSFKEIYADVNYIHDNMDKYFNDIFNKKQRKMKKAKMEKLDDVDIGL